MPATTTPIHSSEISLREFPRALHGFDPEAVSKWLALVELSFTLVEDELERRRHDLDGLLAGLGEVRRQLAGRSDDSIRRAKATWNRMLEDAAESVPATRLGFDTLLIRTALLEAPLRRSFAGYSRDQVRRLLETSAAQLARLENQLHLAHAENEHLMSLLLQEMAEPPDRSD
jgi:hypothetical protein